MLALAAVHGVLIPPVFAVQPPPQVLKPLVLPKLPLAVQPVQLKQVPSVIGMTETQARSALARAGFSVGGISRVPHTAAAGTVVSQSVSPGTRHGPRDPIALQLSLGSRPELKVFKPPVINPGLLNPGAATPPRDDVQPPRDAPPPDDVRPPRPEIKVFKPPVINPGILNPGAATPPRDDVQPPPRDEVQPGFIVVPHLFGATLTRARAQLQLRRLQLGRVERRAHDAAAGTVVDQSPPGGTQLTRPVSVDVVISSGPQLVTVPNVVELQIEPARVRLRDLSQGQISEEWIPSDRPRGIVLRQRPAAGTRIKPVPPPAFRLHVSAGPRRVVPDVIGRSLAEARRRLDGVELRVGAQRETESDVPAGRIVHQRPEGSTDIAANRVEAVDLWISRGPVVEIVVPNVVGDREPAARERIGEAGLDVGDGDRRHAPQAAGIVVEQKPRGGTRVRRDERVRVDLLISLGPAPPPVAKTMPNLVGGALDAVPPLLAPLELAVTTVRSQASIEPKGTVVAQRPAAGAVVKPDTRVEVAVSDGSRVRVPALVGRARDEAAQLLREADLIAVDSTREAQQPPGTVLEQAPQAGREVARGSRVQIVLAAEAQREATTVNVPDVLGVPVTPARQRIEEAGLAVALREADSLTYEAGSIAVQSPAGGTQVARDSIVQLTVSLGLPPLPDLVGMAEPQARGRLAELGLAARVSRQRADDQPRDVVLAQNPAAGVRLSRGAEVALVIAAPSELGAIAPPRGLSLPPAALVAGVAGGALVLAGGGALLARRIRASRLREKPAGKRGAIDARVRLDPAGRVTELTSEPGAEGPAIHFRVRLEHGRPQLHQDDGGQG